MVNEIVSEIKQYILEKLSLADISSLKEQKQAIDRELLMMIDGASELKTFTKQFKEQNEKLDMI